MAGIISPSMPVWVVTNGTHGNRTFSNLNEGLGKVLRFGANSAEVLDRLKWMQQTLAPTLAAAFKVLGELELKPLMAQALHMGDEVHNRNIAASSLLIKRLAPALLKSGAPQADGDKTEEAPPKKEKRRRLRSPAPSRADVGKPEDGAVAEAPAEDKISRRARREEERERERRAKESAKRRQTSTQPAETRQRGRVIGFFISCWAELKRVQWPDRETLIQASAVTVIFIAVMAAYLGALDALFNWLVQRLI